jgi:hypothetical protein
MRTTPHPGHRIRRISRLLLLAACWSVVTPGAWARQPGALAVAIERGLGFVGAAYDGERFADSYLEYVYDQERLPAVGGQRITYRHLDAYFIVRMLENEGISPGPAADLFRRADEFTAALVPTWRDSGIYNLATRSRTGGIALDTYAILAFLAQDRLMAQVIADGLDQDRWLPPGYYTGAEAYRQPADETWALRATLYTDLDPSVRTRVLYRLAARTRELLSDRPDPGVRVILVFHLLETMRDLSSVVSEVSRARAEEWSDLRRSVLDEAVSLLALVPDSLDSLATANLLATLSEEDDVPSEMLLPAVRRLLEEQRDDGGWYVSVGSDPRNGSVFATLRCVLALQKYLRRRDRLPGPDE